MISFNLFLLLFVLLCQQQATAWQPTAYPFSFLSKQRHAHSRLAAATPIAPPPLATPSLTRIPIQEDYPGLERLHRNPDIFVVKDFLDDASCQDIIDQALKQDNLAQSPVAYGGWTDDVKDLIELAAKGPVVWLALLAAWYQTTQMNNAGNSQLDLISHAVQNYVILLVVTVAAIAAWTQARAQGLQELRTSTSTTVDALLGRNQQDNKGSFNFVKNGRQLLQSSPSLFEAPTVIRYQAGQKLAPHYDANRSAETEDANRGGQTVATLIVYLNDVAEGGATRFGLLPSGDDADTKLTVQPQRGDALLFFPASADGTFDEQLEHEGCPAVDEKWIARIWRHVDRVPPPFGLSPAALRQFE